MKNLYLTLALVLIGSTLAHGSELIMRVYRNGQHIVSVSNQTQTNNNNTYQFYNLYGGSTPIKVVDKYSGKIIFKNNLNIPEGYQMTVDLDAYGNMTVISTSPIAGNTGNNGGWTTEGNVGTINYGNNGNNGGTYPGNNGGTTYPYPNNGGGYNNQGQNTNNVYFSQFLSSLKAESFDNNRLQNAKVYASKMTMTAQQIKEVAATFTFDSNRLDWAKAAYNSCTDKANYFLLRETFTFASNYKSLQDFISTQ